MAHAPATISLIIKGAGEMASGIAVRLYRAGFQRIALLEVPAPLAVRRAVSFCEAVYDGSQMVENICADRVDGADEVHAAWAAGRLAVAVDPAWTLLAALSPAVVVDAILAKKNLGTHRDEARLVIGVGPGFVAGVDAHCVVESNRGHDLGRVMYDGAAEANTGIPGSIGGYTVERVLRAPTDGVVQPVLAIGDMVAVGETVCLVDGRPVTAAIPGVVRGCIRGGTAVAAGMKIGDVDPRGRQEYCFTVSEKARALGGAVLEAFCAYIMSDDGS